MTEAASEMSDRQKDTSGVTRLRLFSLFGFEVRLDLSWLLLALLISWSLGAGLFPEKYPGMPGAVYAWMGIAVAIGIFFSIVFHEFAHSLVARHFGMQMRGITLFLFGGVAEMDAEPPNPRSEWLMAIAGPISSFLLAFAFWLLGLSGRAGQWPASIVGVAETMAFINVTVAVFNLVPAFPLDGGRILRAILWQRSADIRAATQTASRMGRGIGIALMVMGVLMLLTGNLIGGMWWFLIGTFLQGAAASSYRQLVINEVIRDRPVSEFMRRDPVTVSPSVSIGDWLDNYVYQQYFKMYPVVENGTLLGCIGTDAIKVVPREQRGDRTVREFLEPCSPENTVAAHTSTARLLRDMVRPGTSTRYMVVEDGRLVGMISLKDLLDLVSLKLEIESR